MKTPLTVRIDTDLLLEARRCANAENRTLTNFIETVLRQQIARTAPTPTKRTKDKSAHVA